MLIEQKRSVSRDSNEEMMSASSNLRHKSSNSNEESKDAMYDANAAVISNPEADEIFQRLIA
jgi:hypothetical protein